MNCVVIVDRKPLVFDDEKWELFFWLSSAGIDCGLGGGVEERADCQSFPELREGGSACDLDSARFVGEQVEVVVTGLCVQVAKAQGYSADEHR